MEDGEVPISQSSCERQSDAIPIRGTTAPYEEVKFSPSSVNVLLNRNEQESQVQEQSMHGPDLVNINKAETRPYEEVTWTPLGYTQLDRNQQEETNNHQYQKLTIDNSGYVIPYTPPPDEEKIKSLPGYTKLDPTKREPDDNAQYQKLMKR